MGYIPQFRFVPDELSHADDSALRGRPLTAVAAAGLMLFARGRAPNLLAELRRWSDVFGYARGRAEGEAKGKAELLIRQLGLQFGALSDATRAKILTAGSERLDVWAERVITGRSLEEILG